MISKFPPIQGGVAARSYWLARGMGEAGAEVEVVTDAGCVEPEYRIAGCEDHLGNLPNVRVHVLNGDVPWHIPFSKMYTVRLLNLVLEVVRERAVDVMDAGFLVPYGIVAFLASRITGLPYVIRHGGSDLVKFLHHPEFSHLVELAMANAASVITDEEHVEQFRVLNPRVEVISPYVPDGRCFKPSDQRGSRNIHQRPVVAYIGKVNYHWQNKRLAEIMDVVARKFDDYQLVFVAQGIGLDDFKQAIGPEMCDRIEFRSFVPPWEMPALISSVDYLVFAPDTVIRSPSNLLREALASGKEVLSITRESAGMEPLGNSFGSWIADNLTVLKDSVKSHSGR